MGPWELSLVALLGLSVALKLINLDRPQLTYWDESFHAVVARNLLKHPFLFTLYDKPALTLPGQIWINERVWFHKPPLALWQIAVSYWLAGTTTLALRLPSVVLSTAAAALTYVLALALFENRLAAFVAAALQAFNPFLVGSVQGYYFADHVDIALVFWVEVGLYALLRAVRDGRTRDYALCGFTTGLAFLAKAFLGLIVLGVLAGLYAATRLRLTAVRQCSIREGQLRTAALAFVLPVASWVAVSYLAYPVDFSREALAWLRHLDANVEQWAAPWDRYLFDYLIRNLPFFYTPALLTVLWLPFRRTFGDLFVALWAWGVIVPLTLAVSKMPSAALIALPALCLAVGRLVQLAWEQRNLTAVAIWAGSTVGLLITGATVYGPAPGAPSADWPAAHIANSWVLWHAAAAALAALVLYRVHVARPVAAQRLAVLAAGLATLLTTVPAAGYLKVSWEVVTRPDPAPSFRDLGRALRARYPETAVFFIGEPSANSGYHMGVMFWADRSTYPLDVGEQLWPQLPLAALLQRVRDARGTPYLLTPKREGFGDPDWSGVGYYVYPLR